MTVQDLQNALRSHGEAPVPANPARHDQVQARIRRIRRRRHAAVAGAAAAALSAAAVLGFVSLSGQAQRDQDAVAVAQRSSGVPAQKSGPPEHTALPRTFTSADGTEYRRLAVTAIAKTGAKKATVTVPVTGKPLDIAAVCSGGRRSSMGVLVRINGRAGGQGPLPCATGRQLVPLAVPAGAGERITVTFELVKRLSGCVIVAGSCVQPDDARVRWSLAVYEWTPPEHPVEPQAPRGLPKPPKGYSPADSRTGTWPRDRSLTFDVLGDGKPIGVHHVCTGDVASRLSFEIELNGRFASRGGCGAWTDKSSSLTLAEFRVPKGKKATITVNLTMRPEAPNRPVRWSVGLWHRQ
ncbi:hypothetical protein [Sphaerisporangium dianthi]|uniref:Uncharacterized protein n=1 Tax=Sphaerisporangium dianthi TaxID=1436120 RepID=A0ABV9CGU8_9ACTN